MSAALMTAPSARVLMTTDAVGGVWTYSLDLARGLAAANVATMLVVLGPSPTTQQVIEAYSVPRLSLVETEMPLDWTAVELAEILEGAHAVRGLARGGRVDLVHLNSPALAAGDSWSVPVVGACHSCLSTWWSAVKDGPMPADFRWRSQALWRGLLNCDALLAPTHAFAEAIRRTYDVPKPQVVWNGRHPAAEAAACDTTESMVLTSGRLWDEAKNVGVLDQAAGLIDVPLFAAGSLHNPAGGETRLQNAQWLGTLSADGMAAWLSRAPIYASSALYEPFGLGILEAAQARCALVLADIPTLRELWDGAAIFVSPNDASAYAEAFSGLLSDPAKRDELAAKAAARAQAFTVAEMTAGVLQVYRQIAPGFAALPLREAAA